MANAEQAFPQVQVRCRDRVRNFSINLQAFRSLEALCKQELKDPDYNVFRDFDWSDNSVENLTRIIYAGFAADAKEDKEPWTLDRAADVFSILSLGEVQACIEKGLEQMLTAEQRKAIQKKRNSLNGAAQSKPRRGKKNLLTS